MPVHLPLLPGRELRNLRTAFKLKQADLAQVCGCSVSAIQKAEAAGNEPIGRTLAQRMAPFLMSEKDVMVELALTLPAVHEAVETGLFPWETPVGRCWWRPNVKSWRSMMALKANRTFSTIDSMAAYLSHRVGVDPDAGVLRCMSCVEQGVSSPNAAFRMCANCGKFLCGDEACGRYVLSAQTPIHYGPPVFCLACIRQETRRVIRRPPVLPGKDLLGQLEAMWAEIQPKTESGDLQHEGFLLVLDDEIDEAESRLSAVRRASRAWPDQLTLEIAKQEAESALGDLRSLRSRVDDHRP